MLKSKEIREYVKSMGHEKGTIYCIEVLAEQHAHITKRLTELAMYFDKVVDSMTGVVAVADRMKAEVQRMQRMSDDDDLPPNTERLGDEQ